MSKFKVGDIVKGNEVSDELYTYTNSKVIEAVVTDVTNDKINIRVLKYDGKREWIGDDNFTGLRSRAFDLVRRPVYALTDWKVVIKPTSNTTTVGRLYVSGELVKEVSTKKHPDDEYNRDEAIRVICDRLVGEKTEEPEKPKYYNGKVVCIDKGGNSWYTVGKIYQFVDGKTTVDTGYVIRRLEPFKTFDEFTEWSTAKWIEVVEE